MYVYAYVVVWAAGWLNKSSYDVAYKDCMSFAVLNHICCCLLIFMQIFRTLAVTDIKLFLRRKMYSKFLRKQSADKQCMFSVETEIREIMWLIRIITASSKLVLNSK